MSSTQRPKMNAVVVHDDPSQAQFLSRLLAEQGFEVLVVESAVLALEKMDAETPPTLLVTGQLLPEIDGWRFCHLLRSQAYRAFNQVPILVISSTFAGGEAARITAALGATAFLSAPLDEREFRGQVRRLLRGGMSQKPTSVLIVEDDASLVERLRVEFQNRGYRVDVAGTGLEAQQRFQAGPYDIVILDHDLPDAAGRDLLVQLRLLHPQTLCIAMTDDEDRALALDWMRRGAAAFVRKPVTANCLLELCSNTQRERELVGVEERFEVRARELHQREERYRQLVESSPAPILAHQNGRFILVNAAAVTLFGARSSEELLRTPVLDRVHPDCRQLVQERIHRMALSGGSVPLTEEKLLRMDGSVITAEVAATSYGYQDQTAFQVVIRDVTVQKEAETALLKSKQRYDELVASIPVGIYTMRSTREAPVAFEYVSPKVSELFGVSVEAFLADPQSAFAPIHPDDIETLVQLNLERYRDLQDFEWEGRAILKGITRWLRIESQPEVQADGTILWNGIISDITERKTAETQLRQSEARYRDLYNKTPVMLHSIDREGRLIGVSDYWLATLGYSREEVMGRNSTDFLTESSRRYAAEVVLPEFRKAGQCQNVEYQYVRKDGRVLDCLLSAISERDDSGQIGRSLAVITDISERKRAEEAFKESSLFNQQIIQDAREGIIVFGPDLRYRVWNPFMEQISGLSARDVLGRTPLEVFPFLRETGMMESLEKALRGEPSEPLEFPFHVPETGYSGWTSNSRGPLRNAKGDIIGVIATVQDITGRKLAEAALQESERRLMLACQSARLGVWDWDVVQNRITWNDQMFELYGMAKEATAFGVEIWEQGLHPEDRAYAWTACQGALRGEKEYDVEFRVQRPDGTIRHVKANGLVVRNQEGKAIRMLGINYDITERKELEERLRQAQKMEAIGQLAGGVAHDFNNILAAIMMYLSLLRCHPKLDKEVQELLMNVGAEAKRAAVLVRQLLLFSRRTAMQVKPTELNEIIRGMMKMLSRLIGEHISIESSSYGGEMWIEADSGMMEQVLMSLVVNARDAMPKGGRLYLTTCTRYVDEDRIRTQPEVRAGKYACLTVRDTGCGMDEAILPHIFEPFFTTKDVGKGTGLGLATVHGIVKQHHGWIEVDSSPEKGTEFRLFFPLHARIIEPCDESETLGDVPRGTETILVVEDEAALRRVTVSWLRSIGYDVLEAANGREAIQHWSQHKERIQLLLSDMVMPEGMTGLELAELCRAENPDLKIIISSGYSTEHSVTRGTTGEGLVYLPKPYDSQVLASVIRESLNRRI